MSEKMEKKLITNEISRPTICQKCGGIMVYKGLGEYQCEDCGTLEYDDYGKVRNYLEVHRGANVSEISSYTGVTHKAIRDMIKEYRFEIIDNRGGYLRCEMCGVNINSGRLCPQCEEKYHRGIEAKAREERMRNQNMSGYGERERGEQGSKRYTRER